MDRLTYTELLCLRVSEGLGTERDFARLRASGIEPSEWMVLPKLIQQAISPPQPPELSKAVCNTLDIDLLNIREALVPQAVPDIQAQVAERLSLPEVEAPIAPVLMDDSEEESDDIVMLSTEQKVESPEDALPALETEPLASALGPSHVPDMMSEIMSAIMSEADIQSKEDENEPMLSLVEEDSDESSEEDIIMLETATILEEPELSEGFEEELVDLSTLPWAEALGPAETPNIVDFVMEEVSKLEIPTKSHLRLVSEAKEDVPHVYRERIGDVDVEIQDISSPRVIDGDSAAGNGSFWLLLAAVAAVAFLVVQNFISESAYKKREMEPSNIAQSIEILDLNSDDMTQIQVDGSMTIIFIDAGE